MKKRDYQLSMAATVAAKKNRETVKLEDGRKIKVNAFPRRRSAIYPTNAAIETAVEEIEVDFQAMDEAV